MEIVFCERCDASIPHADLERGDARTVEGLLLCVSCRARDARRRLAAALLLPLAVLAAAALGAAVAVLVVAKPLRTLRDDVAERAAAEAVAKGERADLFGAVARMTEGEEALAAGIAEAVRRAAADADALRTALAAAEARLLALEDETVRVKEALRGLMAPAAPAGEAAPPPARPDDPEAWLGLLEDADPGVRLSALVALEGEDDPRVAERCLALLGDPDGAVRAQAAAMLGSRRDERAVGALLDLLTEPDAAVRASAHRALAAIAGQSLDFYDPADPEEARVAGAARVRELLGGK